MNHRAAKSFIAFVRSPATLPALLSVVLVVTLFLQLFATWDPQRDVVGYMYLFVLGFFWFCVASGLALLAAFAFFEFKRRFPPAEPLIIFEIRERRGSPTPGTSATR